MKATLLAVLGILAAAACGSPSAPSTTPPTLSPPVVPPVVTGATVSGFVYEADSAGRRPLAGATVELAESPTAWGASGRPTTDAAGRYVSAALPPGHYLARATKAGYVESSAVNLGYVQVSRTLDFELSTPAAMAAPPSVAAVSPGTGSTGGETTVKITGTGFRSGATVAFGGLQKSAYVENSTTMHSTTPVHGAGAVDVVVTNPGGLAGTLPGGYTYALPEAFDFNGTWVGYALSHPELATRFGVLHSDMDMRFTIQNKVLITVSCGTTATLTLSPPPSVIDGEFSFAGNGVTITGRIVSATGAVGTINTVPCPATRWTATRQ